MRYPVTDILSSGPNSKGILEKTARRGTDLELIEESNDDRSEMPSPPEVEDLVDVSAYAGASGSVGEALYMMSCTI